MRNFRFQLRVLGFSTLLAAQNMFGAVAYAQVPIGGDSGTRSTDRVRGIENAGDWQGRGRMPRTEGRTSRPFTPQREREYDARTRRPRERGSGQGIEKSPGHRRAPRTEIKPELAEQYMIEDRRRAALPSDVASNVAKDERAALAGNVEAQVRMGTALASGELSFVNYEKAAWYLKRAADKGNHTARYKLAQLYVDDRLQDDNRFEKAVELLKPVAEQGVPEAQVMLGNMYEQGHGVPQDLSVAQELYYGAIELPQAQFALANLLSNQSKTAADMQTAAELYEQLYRKDSKEYGLDSAYRLAQLAVRHPLGIAEEVDARRWLERAASGGHQEAQVQLGATYQYGIGGDRDLEKAKMLFEDFARQGNAEAQLKLARLYEVGIGTDRDVGKALSWYERAAAAGKVSASLSMARIYAQTDSPLADIREAREALRTAADSNEPFARVAYGDWLLQMGERQAALEQFRLAADQNDLGARFRIARAQRFGIGIDADPVKAREAFRALAEQGEVRSQTSYGEMLLVGQGGPVDAAQAARWIKSGAEGGDSRAMSRLGDLYESGTGVRASEKASYEWTLAAAESGDPEAIQKEPERLRRLCASKDGTCVTIPLLYLTERKFEPNAPAHLSFANERETNFPAGPEGRSHLHYGLLWVTVPLNPADAKSQQGLIDKMLRALGWRPPSPAVVSVLQDIQRFKGDQRESKSTFSKLLASTLESPADDRILLFVHGYNNSFAFAAKRMAEFVMKSGFTGVPVLYSWPSHNATLAYGADRDEAILSCSHLSAAVDVLLDSAPKARIDVVAHSMGADILFNVLKGGKEADCAGPRQPFHDLIFAAPDIFAAAFKRSVDFVLGNAKRVSVYASKNDWALLLEQKLIRFNQSIRLGQGGDNLTLVAGVHSLDASKLDTLVRRDLPQHGYVFLHGTVINDVRQLLTEDKHPNSRACLSKHTRESLDYWVFEPVGSEKCAG